MLETEFQWVAGWFASDELGTRSFDSFHDAHQRCSTEAGCLAHARRKFHELWANHKSSVAEQALALFGKLYHVEREVADLDAERRRAIRLEKAKPIADALRTWLTAQRQKVPPGSATAKAADDTLGRWAALTRYIDDGDLPADNNWAEIQIRPIAIG